MISAMENSPRAFPHAPKCTDKRIRVIIANTERFDVETRKGKTTGKRFCSNSKKYKQKSGAL